MEKNENITISVAEVCYFPPKQLHYSKYALRISNESGIISFRVVSEKEANHLLNGLFSTGLPRNTYFFNVEKQPIPVSLGVLDWGFPLVTEPVIEEESEIKIVVIEKGRMYTPAKEEFTVLLCIRDVAIVHSKLAKPVAISLTKALQRQLGILPRITNRREKYYYKTLLTWSL